MEDLYPGWDGLAASTERLVEEVLRPWSAGQLVRAPRWDWDGGGWLGPDHDVVLAPGPLLVVEGVGAGARAAAPWTDVLVWVQAPAPVRRARALARDGETYAPHWDRWTAQEVLHLARSDPGGRADVVVRT